MTNFNLPRGDLDSFFFYVTRVQYVKEEILRWVPHCLHIQLCGDPKERPYPKAMLKENELHWFPMRVRNSSISRLELMMDRLNQQKDHLQKEDIVFDAYAPLGFIRVSMTKMDFAPYLLNYLFVRSTFAQLVKIKSNQELFEPLRFVMHPAFDERLNRHDEVLFMSDKSMDDYKRITAEANEKIVFLQDLKYACKPSREVQITQGKFTGVIGRIKRIQGYRCVVVPIGSELAPAIVDVPNAHLRYLTDEESRLLSPSVQGYTPPPPNPNPHSCKQLPARKHT